MSTQQVAAESYARIPLSALTESPTNPRRTFDPVKLAELTASVKTKGVIEPIIARPLGKPNHYEIVVGARRYRASVAAGREDIPAIVRSLSDVDVLEIQIIENLQREDVHPLEEGDGYAQLLRQPNYTIEIIAAKVGHPADYVAKRLQLAKLIIDARQAFMRNEINVGHAQLLARLPADKQKTAFEYVFETQQYRDPIKGLMRTEPRAITVHAFDVCIREHIMLDLHSAPWKKDDPDLFKPAGACTVCPKRTGANAHLFDDMKKGDHCLDAVCYEKKRDAHIVQIQERAKSEGRKLVRIATRYLGSNDEKKYNALSHANYTPIDGKKQACTNVEEAIVVHGSDLGQLKKICRAPKCPVHRPYGGSSTRAEKKDYWEERAKALDKRIQIEAGKRTLRQILAKVNATTFAVTGSLEVILDRLLPHTPTIELAEAIDPSAKKGVHVHEIAMRRAKGPNGLPVVCMAAALYEATKEWSGEDDIKRLLKAAGVFKVDHAVILHDTQKEMSADFKKRRDAARMKKLAEAAKKSPTARTKADVAKIKKAAKAGRTKKRKDGRA